MRVLERGSERVEIAIADTVVTVQRFVAGKLVDTEEKRARSSLKAKWEADRICAREVAAGFARVGGDDDIVAIDQSELFAAIDADPDDLDTRLVLADWLTERGDPWGQLIAVQHALAHLPRVGERERRDALDREEALLRFKHAARLWGELGETIVNISTQTYASDLIGATWHVGFVREAVLDRVEPRVQQLVHALATLPHARLLRSLSVTSEAWPAGTVEAIGAERWPHLRTLVLWPADHLTNRRLAAERVLPLLRASCTPTLAELDVTHSSETDQLCAAVAMPPLAHRLRRLELHRAELTELGIAALANADLPQLETLRLTGTGPRDAARTLAKKAKRVMIDLRAVDAGEDE